MTDDTFAELKLTRKVTEPKISVIYREFGIIDE